MIRHCVYRFYDANCVLLYVGRSANVGQRVQSHQSSTRWFADVDTISVEHCDDANHASAVEAAAIRSERPLHNIHLNPEGSRARRYDDESAWRTQGLVMSPDFFSDFTAGQEFDEIARRSELTASELTMVVDQRLAVDINVASAIARALGCRVAALFPNRRPEFSHPAEDRLPTLDGRAS